MVGTALGGIGAATRFAVGMDGAVHRAFAAGDRRTGIPAEATDHVQEALAVDILAALGTPVVGMGKSTDMAPLDMAPLGMAVVSLITRRPQPQAPQSKPSGHLSQISASVRMHSLIWRLMSVKASYRLPKFRSV
jgi:hypothetical protein